LSLFTYTFQGGKIEVSNEKLSDNIDASAGSSDIVIGKGKITVPESIKLNDIAIQVTSSIDPTIAIETFKMIIGNEEVDGTPDTTAGVQTTRTYTFKSATIDESDVIEFVVDLHEETANGDLK
jgi:hypothetical protein